MGKAHISSFSYDCELAFNSIDGKSTPILKECIKYIMVDHNFNTNIMPIMYIKVRLFPSIYNKMVPQQGQAKLYLNLYRTRNESTSATPKKVIYDEFDYFMTDDPNGFKKIDETTNSDNGTSYKECFIGLIKMDLQKQNQKSFEGIFKNTDAMSLVQSATSGMKMIMQPFDYNTKYSNFVCPPIGSIGQFISYLNSQNAFYKGSYTYYMDNDKTYLRSNDGSYMDAKDNDLKYIAFDVRDLTSTKSVTTGIVEDPDQDAYIIYVPSNDAKIVVDRVTSSLVGNVQSISGVTGSVVSANVDTSKITSIGTAGSSSYISSDDPNASKNIATKIAETSDTLIITKIDMDSRIFTLNKQYLLCNYEDNPKYCGVYYLTHKQEIYLRNGDQMSCQMTLTLKKCADFVK